MPERACSFRSTRTGWGAVAGPRRLRSFARQARQLIKESTGPATCLDCRRDALRCGLNGLSRIVNRVSSPCHCLVGHLGLPRAITTIGASGLSTKRGDATDDLLHSTAECLRPGRTSRKKTSRLPRPVGPVWVRGAPLSPAPGWGAG